MIVRRIGRASYRSRPTGNVAARVSDSKPDTAIVRIEIPKGSRNKYEYDRELDAIKLDRFLFSSMVYPTDYGYFPETHAEDGDALDAMVCVSEPTFPGCIIEVKPIALFKMKDDQGIDDKILCVPCQDPGWNTLEQPRRHRQAAPRRDRALLLRLQGPRAEEGHGRRVVLPRGRDRGDRQARERYAKEQAGRVGPRNRPR